MTLGERIREVRQTYGMSQAELSRRLGITTNTMNNLEQGRIPSPGFWHVYRIAVLFGLPVDALVRDVEPPPPGHQRQRRLPARTA
jgi:transcriptional regulator with XRE-family HTH domain